MRGGNARACLWLPSMPDRLQWFDVEYEWEEYPEQGNGWDDPGAGGSFYLTSVTGLTEEHPPKFGIEVPRAALEARVAAGGKTLDEAICDNILEDAYQTYYGGDFYDPVEWYY